MRRSFFVKRPLAFSAVSLYALSERPAALAGTSRAKRTRRKIVPMIWKNCKALQPELVEMRRDLHRIPEVGTDLPETSAYIAAKLD